MNQDNPLLQERFSLLSFGSPRRLNAEEDQIEENKKEEEKVFTFNI